MRLTDYVVAAGAIVNAARVGSHEITALGLAHLDELLELASKDAAAIEARLREADAQRIVKSIPELHAPADYSIVLPPEEPAWSRRVDDLARVIREGSDALVDEARSGNVVAFPAHLVKRWPLLSQQPEAHDVLMAIARSGELGPKDGGDAA
jgi:hypothetical protein